MTLLEIQIAREKSEALAALFRQRDKNPWPEYKDDPEKFMERARELIDAARLIYPNA